MLVRCLDNFFVSYTVLQNRFYNRPMAELSIILQLPFYHLNQVKAEELSND